MTLLLAVSGKKQSGKDTLVGYLQGVLSQCGTVNSYSFADEIKSFLVNVMGVDRACIYGTDAEKNQPTQYLWDNLSYEIRKQNALPESQNELRSGLMTGRELMQVFGTDIMRTYFNDRIWINATLRKIYRDQIDFALLADMRFPSELEAWLDHDGLVIRLLRDVSNRDRHKSEVALDDFDWSEIDSNSLVVPESATIQECRRLSLEWLTSKVGSHLSRTDSVEDGKVSHFLSVIENALQQITETES